MARHLSVVGRAGHFDLGDDAAEGRQVLVVGSGDHAGQRAQARDDLVEELLLGLAAVS